MRLFVKATVFETIHRDDDVKAVREMFRDGVNRMKQSGHLVDMGIFADGRGGYMILDVESAEEMFDLLGGGRLVDRLHLESHPVVSFEALERMFEEHGVG